MYDKIVTTTSTTYSINQYNNNIMNNKKTHNSFLNCVTEENLQI